MVTPSVWQVNEGFIFFTTSVLTQWSSVFPQSSAELRLGLLEWHWDFPSHVQFKINTSCVINDRLLTWVTFNWFSKCLFFGMAKNHVSNSPYFLSLADSLENLNISQWKSGKIYSPPKPNIGSTTRRVYGSFWKSRIWGITLLKSVALLWQSQPQPLKHNILLFFCA